MRRIRIESAKYGTHYALVDDEDYELVSKYRWNLSPTFSRDKKLNGKLSGFYAIHSFFKRKPDGSPGYTSIKMHRLIVGRRKIIIDHKNRNGLDNRRCNIRMATNSQNGANAMHTTSKSGYKGVCYRKDKSNRPFQVRIRVNDKIIHGGFFDDPVSAAEKYNSLAIIHFGEFARLNQI